MAELTYCSNIHPGEHWADVMHNLDSHALEVKARVSPTGAFPLGLRIAQQAALEADDNAIAEFRAWCKRHNCYLLTINGFPYGTFHNRRVKENVYLPDWRSAERASYSKRLGDLAVKLEPGSKRLSISTVPIAFKPAFDTDATDEWELACGYVRDVAEHYYQLYQQTGVLLVLSLEPEPMCVLETTDEAIQFFKRLNLPEYLRPHVGLCFDGCHQAVEFERASDCLQRILDAGITIGKVQISSALKATGDEIPKLLEFDEPVYLHQAVAHCQHTNQLHRFTDLTDFKQALQQGQNFDECRVHFHIPIFLEHLGECGTTQDFLRELLPQLDSHIPLEVETYSFAAIPEKLRTDTVSESIARELLWVKALLD